MNKAKRRVVIAGNWKMNKNRAEAKVLITELLPLVKEAGCEVVLCTPYTNLETALALTEGSNVKVGAENCHWAESGAFTGEISAPMLKELGVQYVIIGHSERRQYFGETDETVAKRVRAALESGLEVILCVGETLEQREADITGETIAIQVKKALAGVTADEKATGTYYHGWLWPAERDRGQRHCRREASQPGSTVGHLPPYPNRSFRAGCGPAGRPDGQ